MTSVRWEAWETDFLRDVGGTMPIHLIAEKLERSNGSIYSKAAAIGVELVDLRRGKTWTQPELFLIGRFSPEEIAEATGRSLPSVRCKINLLARTSGGKTMREWSREELALLWRHSNEEVAELTGRSIEEVGDKRLQTNIERNGWDKFDPERAA